MRITVPYAVVPVVSLKYTEYILYKQKSIRVEASPALTSTDGRDIMLY